MPLPLGLLFAFAFCAPTLFGFPAAEEGGKRDLPVPLPLSATTLVCLRFEIKRAPVPLYSLRANFNCYRKCQRTLDTYATLRFGPAELLGPLRGSFFSYLIWPC